MLCQECGKRERCTELCNRAEKYVRQDHVPQRHSLYGGVNESGMEKHNLPLDRLFYFISIPCVIPYVPSRLVHQDTDEPLHFPFLSPIQNRCLYLYYFKGLSYAEITKHAHIKQTKVNYQIYSAKQRISKFLSRIHGNSESIQNSAS